MRFADPPPCTTHTISGRHESVPSLVNLRSRDRFYASLGPVFLISVRVVGSFPPIKGRPKDFHPPVRYTPIASLPSAFLLTTHFHDMSQIAEKPIARLSETSSTYVRQHDPNAKHFVSFADCEVCTQHPNRWSRIRLV